MSWWKSIFIGFCIYLGIFALGFVLCMGFGYTYPNLANTFAEIMAFPTGTGKNYNLILSSLFWTIIIGLIIKSYNIVKTRK